MGFVFRFGKNFYKTAIIIFGFLLAFYIIIEFRLWGMEWTEHFLRFGSLEEVIFISLVVMAIGIIVPALLKWFVRLELR